MGGATTYYVYDGEDVAGETDSTGATTRTYSWGALGLISDHGSGAGSDRYYDYDAHGNTSALADSGGNVSGRGAYTPYGSPLGQELPTPYTWQGQSGNRHEREAGMYIGISHAPYVPAAPTYVAPSGFQDTNPYQAGNANPVSYGAADDGDDDPFPVDDNGRARAYQPMRRGLHQLAGHMKDALNFAAGFNPIYQVGEIVTGQNAAGECVPASQRVLGAVLMAAGPVAGRLHGLGALGKAGEAAEAEGQTLIRVNKRARGGGPAHQSAETLQWQSLAAAADAQYGVHEVSVRTPESLSRPVQPYYGQATVEQIQQHFPVTQTGPHGHYTVGLPNPVTEEAAEIFNRLFGFPIK